MNIIQCSICKKPFHSIGAKVCNECLQKMDQDFITVRDYIYENKHADIDKVSEETGVSKKVIMYLLKDGRLIIEDSEGGGGGMLFCEVCRKPINTGRMCKDCKDKVANTMQKSISTGKPQQAASSKDSTPLRGTAKLNK